MLRDWQIGTGKRSQMGQRYDEGEETVSTGYERRYAGLTPKQCDREAILLMQESVNGRRTWEDVAERLVTLKRVKSYAPCPLDDCKVVWSRVGVE